MTTEEYLEKYPEMRPYWDNREYRVVNDKGRKQAYIRIKCIVCGKEIVTRWNPLFPIKECTESTYKCGECNNLELGRRLGTCLTPEEKSRVSKKAMTTMGPEGLRARAIRMQENKGSEYRKEIAKRVTETQKRNKVAIFSAESRAKSYNTAKERGTFLRSQLELDIEKEFGGQHSAPEFKFELDCYWPELSKGVEVDDRSHAKKRQGYHKEKDEYFRSLGISVLHLSLSPEAIRRPGFSNWKELVREFLYGNLNEEFLYMEEDPYHCNG